MFCSNQKPLGAGSSGGRDLDGSGGMGGPVPSDGLQSGGAGGAGPPLDGRDGGGGGGGGGDVARPSMGIHQGDMGISESSTLAYFSIIATNIMPGETYFSQPVSKIVASFFSILELPNSSLY